MKRVLDTFFKVTGNMRLDDIDKDKVAAYWQWEVDHSPTHSYRTAHNRVEMLRSFLKEYGIDIIGRGVDMQRDKRWLIPPFVEETPEVYTEEEIEKIMAGSDLRHRAAYTAMFKGMLREGEAVYLTWDCVDVLRSIIHVKAKSQYNWKPKKNFERSVVVPREVVTLIASLPRTGSLVFGRTDGKPDKKFLPAPKAIAKQAGIDPERV